MKKLAVFIAVLAVVILAGGLFFNRPDTDAANLANFRPGNIISDEVFTNNNSMSANDIQNFLNSKNSCIRNMTWPGIYDINGDGMISDRGAEWYGVWGRMSSAQVIKAAADIYRINPQVILATLQKESSLITRGASGCESAATYAMGANCPDGSGCNTATSGFVAQVDYGTSYFRIYMNGKTNYPVGKKYVLYHPNIACGGSEVYIENKATGALYTYTPYQPNQAALNAGYGTGNGCSSYGNRNFYQFFTDWFGATTFTIPKSNVYLPDGDYTLTNTQSSKALDVYNAGTADSTNVQIVSQNGSNAQKWNFTRDSDGFYTIKGVGSNKYLDVSSASTNDGANVQIYTGNGSCAQKWSVILTGGKYNLLSACSGKALDVAGGSTANGSNVQIWASNGSGAQTWAIKALSSAPIADDIYYIKTTGGKSLDIDNTSTSNGANVKIWTAANYNIAQIWKLNRNDDGFYTLINPNANKALDVAGAGSADGTNVQIYNGNNSCAQKWQIKSSGTYYILLSACSDKALDVANGAINTAGANVWVYADNGTNAQKWRFEKYVAPVPVVANGNYEIVSAINDNFAMDVSGGLVDSGTVIQMYQRNNTGAQKWSVQFDQVGMFYTITNIKSGKAIDVSDANAYAGAKIQQWSSNGTNAQKWDFRKNSDGTYTLVSKLNNNLVIDVSGALATNGTRIQLWANNESKAQKWNFKLLSQ